MRNVDASLETDLGKLRVSEVIDILQVKHQVLLTEPPEVHVELSGDDRPRHDVDDGRIDWNLLLEQAQDVVDGVQSRDWLDAHKVGHVHQRPRLKHAELAILCEKPSIL